MDKQKNDYVQPSAKVSRRHLIALSVLLGTTAIASISSIGEAEAKNGRRHWKRKKWHRHKKYHHYKKHHHKHYPVCFLRGTHIRTPSGEVAVESLQIGDLVTTASGRISPVKWLGRMSFERDEFGTIGKSYRPIKIAQGGIDGRLPNRDLYLSAGHHVYLDGVLIPAGDLVNGINITEFDAADRDVLQYLHIELDKHDIVFAEGLTAETLLVTSTNRMTFDNYSEFTEIYGCNDKAMLPFAPMLAFRGGRGELRSRLRSAIAPICDRRDVRDIARDRVLHLALRAHQSFSAHLDRAPTP